MSAAQRRVCTACTCARHLQRVARAMLLPRHAAGCVRVGRSCRARCERSRVAAKMSCRLRRHCSPTGPKRVQRKFVTRKEQTLSYSHGFRIARSKPRLRQCAADAWRCQPSARRVELHSRRSRTREPPNWSETGARLVGFWATPELLEFYGTPNMDYAFSFLARFLAKSSVFSILRIFCFTPRSACS